MLHRPQLCLLLNELFNFPLKFVIFLLRVGVVTQASNMWQKDPSFVANENTNAVAKHIKLWVGQ